MIVTRIFLCRHAHPENPDHVFYGHLPGFGLSALGVRQAIGLGRHLRPYPVVKVYASPLQRAQETASLAVGQLATPVPIETREDLVETAWGKHIQGVPQAQVIIRRPSFLVHLARPGLLASDESVPLMAARVGRVVGEAMEACRGSAGVLVSHADPVKAFWNRHLGRADWRFHLLDLPKGGFLELVFEDDRLAVIHPHPPAPADPV